MIGAVGHGDPMVDGAELARWLAQKLNADYHYISAPLLVESDAVAEALLRERSIAEALALATRVELAIIGIGTVDPALSSLLRAGYIPEQSCACCRSRGGGRRHGAPTRRVGQLLDVPFNHRVIGLQDIARLRDIPVVMGVAGGVARRPPSWRRSAAATSTSWSPIATPPARSWSWLRSQAGEPQATGSGSP